MKRAIAACLAVLLTAAPIAAQEEETREGFDLMEEGARLIMRGVMRELQPALDDFATFAEEIEPAMRLLAQEMGPALAELMTRIDDIRHYEAPEILENGDIIIRRRPDAPAFAPPEPIDL